MKATILGVTAMTLLAGLTAPAFAAPTVFSGYDAGAGSLATAPNATQAASDFDAAVSGATLVDFETGLPSGFSFVGGAVRSDSTCTFTLCGGNTTPGGERFHLVAGAAGAGSSVTYSFATPISFFGAYFSGFQLGGQSLSYTSGGQSVLIQLPQADNSGGILFFGFMDAAADISSITYTRLNDIVAVDDVRFGLAVPEPATLALLGLGFAGVGFGAARRRRAN